MDKKVLRLKLAKMLAKFAEIETDKGNLIYEGDFVEGVEVFVEKEGEIVPAEDGEYIYEEKTVTVKEGKVESIKEAEKPVEEPVQEAQAEAEPQAEPETPAEPETDPKDEEIAKLNDIIVELKKEIEAKDAEIAELKGKPSEAPIEMGYSKAVKASGAMKYFE
jgi:hypothetical protein